MSSQLHLDRIEKAIDFIEGNLKEDLKLDTIAKDACYSKYHFTRLFSQITGKTLRDYIKNRRITEAAIDLVMSDVSILQIALRYQFDSQEAFTRSFQSVFGVSPGNFRKKAHKIVDFKCYTLSPSDFNELKNSCNMEPEIVQLEAKKIIGIKIITSLSENRTVELWQGFMKRRHEIKNNLNTGFYSIQTYNAKESFESFNEKTIFEKWAAVEVENFNHIPEGMESHTLVEGKYAVFIHYGPTKTFDKTLNHIFKNWLPKSGYELDNRDHFEIMGEKYYGPTHPKSEEEIWIPIK